MPIDTGTAQWRVSVSVWHWREFGTEPMFGVV